MTIRSSTITINAVGVVVMLVAVLAVSTPFLFHGFRNVENSQVTDLSKRSASAIAGLHKSLAVKEYDWANWNDAYVFVQNHNTDFIDSNFGGKTDYVTPVFDMALFYDVHQKLVYTNGASKAPPELLANLQPGSQLLKYSNDPKANPDTSLQSGLLVVNGKILILSSSPLLHTDGTGPPKGTLVFGEYLEQEETDQIDSSISPLLDLYTLQSSDLPDDVKEASVGLKAGQTRIRVLNSDYIAGYTVINDIFGKPAIVARVQEARDINKVALNSIKTYTLAVVVIGIVIGVLRQLFFEKLVSRRLTRFTESAIRIKNNQGFDERLKVDGNDEVTQLGMAINAMLNRLSASSARNAELLHESKHYQRELQKEKADVEKLVAERTLQLEEETNLFSASINSLPLGFMITDVNLNILKINPQIKSMLTEHELPSSAKESHHPFMVAITELLRKPAKAHSVRSMDFTTNTGRYLHLVTAPVISKTSGVKGFVIVVDDVTEKMIAERSKDEFFSIASHELRTPLTAIRGNSSMLKEYHRKDLKKLNMDAMVDDIYVSSVRLIEIVNDFLDVSRLEQGRMEFDVTEFEIEAVIKDIITEMKTIASEKNLNLHFEAPAHLPKVRADHDRIKQVMYNLLGNAIKFTDTGSVSVKVTLDKHTITITVSDTGRGISPAGQRLLFHKFQQTGSSLYTRDTTRGTGLGLYISKLIVERSGGTIMLDSSHEGTGSSFSFTLPIVKK